MTEEEFIRLLEAQSEMETYEGVPDYTRSVRAYRAVLAHLLDNVVDPRDSAKGIVHALESRLKKLES
ncbi:hypothetical protein ACFQS3_02375 [Glycomyces mayteni]|uniref:Uncharacterized protein n=1 Tax=Glycomyces mayteni TaxID=543887 RepID=A0ABW2D1W9_9ACTN|nr:hypothetical protein GCM10025732_47730 [Glycomyces mayteni]